MSRAKFHIKRFIIDIFLRRWPNTIPRLGQRRGSTPHVCRACLYNPSLVQFLLKASGHMIDKVGHVFTGYR